MKSTTKQLGWAYGIGILLLSIDFLTKGLANRLLPFQESVATRLPFLFFYRTHNVGYHWIFGSIDHHQLWAVAGIGIVVLIAFSITRSILRNQESGFNLKSMLIILSLIVGSAGNVLEVLLTGKATDFFIFRPFPWPSNICDQYINAVIYIMLPITLVKAFIDWRREKRLREQGSGQ